LILGRKKKGERSHLWVGGKKKKAWKLRLGRIQSKPVYTQRGHMGIFQGGKGEADVRKKSPMHDMGSKKVSCEVSRNEKRAEAGSQIKKKS